ncbi:hypothetical protein AB0D46_13815 [Streptomyces sp. NPDC048383]|uniref:hypothetical protein n=1 Tax=Streptomyces sp. NPDC048383 TaxID=3155386 RepID=UPI0034318775
MRHDQLLEHRLRTMRRRLPEASLLARVAPCLAVLAGITVLVAAIAAASCARTVAFAVGWWGTLMPAAGLLRQWSRRLSGTG